MKVNKYYFNHKEWNKSIVILILMVHLSTFLIINFSISLLLTFDLRSLSFIIIFSIDQRYKQYEDKGILQKTQNNSNISTSFTPQTNHNIITHKNHYNYDLDSAQIETFKFQSIKLICSSTYDLSLYTQSNLKYFVTNNQYTSINYVMELLSF